MSITEIPRIMDDKKWTQGAHLLRSWFARPPATKPQYGKPDTTTIKMDWVLGFKRARQLYDSIFQERIWANEPARQLMLKRVLAGKIGAFHAFDQTCKPVSVLEDEYVNSRPCTNLLSELHWDGLTAALNRFNFRVVVAGSMRPWSSVNGIAIPTPWDGDSPHTNRGSDLLSSFIGGPLPTYEVTVTKVGVYIQDSFDFEGFQPLGHWPGVGFVSNADFRSYRAEKNMGGDFLVYSNVKTMVLPHPTCFTI